MPLSLARNCECVMCEILGKSQLHVVVLSRFFDCRWRTVPKVCRFWPRVWINIQHVGHSDLNHFPIFIAEIFVQCDLMQSVAERIQRMKEPFGLPVYQRRIRKECTPAPKCRLYYCRTSHRRVNQEFGSEISAGASYRGRNAKTFGIHLRAQAKFRQPPYSILS